MLWVIFGKNSNETFMTACRHKGGMKIAGGPHPHPNPPLEGEGSWMLTFPLKGREAGSNEFNELMWYFQVKMPNLSFFAGPSVHFWCNCNSIN
jgi:hypothetical protein